MAMTQVTYPYTRPSGPGQVISYTGTAGVTANVVPLGCAGLWIFCTSVAYVKVGSGSPVATSADFPVPASVPFIYMFDPNENDGKIKVSAVQSAAGGNLHVCPIGY